MHLGSPVRWGLHRLRPGGGHSPHGSHRDSAADVGSTAQTTDRTLAGLILGWITDDRGLGRLGPQWASTTVPRLCGGWQIDQDPCAPPPDRRRAPGIALRRATRKSTANEWCGRDLTCAAFYRINPATAAKGVGMLVDKGVVYKRRGIGMFVAPGARELLLAERREAFGARYLDPLLAEARNLGLDEADLTRLIRERASAPIEGTTR